ncbi:hypothetical protein RA307_12475 [Xanthobacteraceae bacterium Astr-EGSB]|uniref:hypothetical protein n=1 Tax=Astrobacterium formosum TaxID=3069710 RepID=UPI0027AF0EEC|nr:hypothetical protein [Xanthobacteraceae bacterium Astr-EGSB]
MSPADTFALYGTRNLLLDTNLLVLLAVGHYRRDQIPNFKRTKNFSADDYAWVAELVDESSRCITTPHILAEVDNLTRQLPEREHEAVAIVLASLVAQHFELYRPSKDAVLHPRYSHLGLSDCGLLLAAGSEDMLVVTDDFALSNILARLGHSVVNFNHVRRVH